MVLNQKERYLDCILGRNPFLGGYSRTGTGCLENLWMLILVSVQGQAGWGPKQASLV